MNRFFEADEPSRTRPQAIKWGNASLIAQDVIQSRVEAHNEELAKRGTEQFVPSLVAITLERLAIVNFGVAASMADIPIVMLESYIWKWHMMPYPMLYQALLRISSETTYTSWEGSLGRLFVDSRIDEWILLNEKWLRGRDHEDWRHGMVTLHDADIVFPNSNLTESARIILRPDSLPGYEILSDGREQKLRIQPSTEAFKRNFEHFSGGLLKNIEWNNVLVAGGIVLGALYAVEDQYEYYPGQWMSSDIDIYLYGLSPSEANKKIQHIFESFRSNLPPQMRVLVVRNSKTITFYADYPLRRIQIVLKFARHPKDVLLNFDLDICAMGWDGNNIWMLPRATRALETGYNTFTMSLVHGHYLLDRRASQLQRIFKYADKGYGIRFLPSYISSLNHTTALDLPFLEEEARSWTADKLGPHFSHSDLFESFKFGCRSALSGFVSLMRHVALKEMGHANLIEQNDWASVSYDEVDVDIQPLRYQWNAAFKHSGFRAHIIHSNLKDVDDWIRNDLDRRLQEHGVESGDELNLAQRMTFAPTVEDLLDSANDVRMPILLPVDFALYANGLVNEVQRSAGLPGRKVLEPVMDASGTFGDPQSGDGQLEGLYMWTIDSHLMWQQVDRRVDELFEVLYAFRRANRRLDEDLQLLRFTMEISKRNELLTSQDEFETFAQWISRRPEI